MENVKKRGFQPEKSGGSPASTHKKPLICPFWEKASMENHFEFWALKGPKTRMNIDKMGWTSKMSTPDGASADNGFHKTMN